MDTELNDGQWALVRPLLPAPNRRGRPRADDRRTVDGILYVLRAGCRWQDMPRRYGSPVTCWRRLSRWQQDGTWERVWRSLLSTLDDQDKLDWSQGFMDATFVSAKKGASL